MNFGVSVPLPAYLVDVGAMARTAERLGFESFWCAEHPFMPVRSTSSTRSSHWPAPRGPRSGSAWAPASCSSPSATRSCSPRKSRRWTASAAGRFLFGIGAGWLREETEIMGGDFDHRWTQTRESVLAMKAPWTQLEAEFQSRYYRFPPVRSYPKPVQQPHPPVLLGGSAKNVLQRVVAWGDGWLPNRATPEQIRESRATLDRLATGAGREPSALTISLYGQPADRDLIRRFHDAGATRVIVRPATVQTDGAMADQLQRIAETVLR